MILGTLNDHGLTQFCDVIKELRRKGKNKTVIPLEHLEVLMLTAMYYKAVYEKTLKEDKPNDKEPLFFI